jgi:hypothetical protein
LAAARSTLPFGGGEQIAVGDLLHGFWQVAHVDMVSDRAVSSVAGTPGELVEFRTDGRYVVWGDPAEPEPLRYVLRLLDTEPPSLDIGMAGLPKSQCIYCVAGDELRLCVAGDHGPRPTDIRRDDTRLWLVKTHVRWRGDPPVIAPTQPRRTS